MLDKKLFKQIISNKILITDGAMGTLLQDCGLHPGQAPEELNIINPGAVQSVHDAYLESGSNIIFTNTFGATSYKLKEYNLQNKTHLINTSAVKLAKEAAKHYEAFVAGGMGPLGYFLTPIGTIEFDEAYAHFAEQAKAFADADADIIVIETMSDIREIKAALLASKDNFRGPIIVSATFTKEGRTVTGTDISTFANVVQSMGADSIGFNCSVGPKHLLPLLKKLVKYTNLPISVKPNRGLPQLINNETVFPGTVKEFIYYSKQFIKLGANLLGGCCGTTPEFIGALAELAKKSKSKKRKINIPLRLSSRTKTIEVNSLKKITIIGERINPTGRKLLQEELRHNNFTTIMHDAREQAKNGADLIDVNMGLPGGDENKLLAKACELVQSLVDLPICIDSSSTEALEAGLKQSTGKPLINSVNGEDSKLEKILPLAKRYGAALICLTMDDAGIPESAKDRIKIAKKIITQALKIGIPQTDILIDNLTLSLSTQQNQAKETLKAIRICKNKLKIKTVLGVSNISYGLPNRELINSTFLKMAKKAGLDFAIINPYHKWNIFNEYAYKALTGKDKSCLSYIKKYGSTVQKPQQKKRLTAPLNQQEILYNSIIEGRKDLIVSSIQALLKQNMPPLQINNTILIKALTEVGEKFERKQLFLPQVLLAAETMQLGFSYLKNSLSKDEIRFTGKILLATVKGDIHDIGKNIVAAVMESYGWQVIDLGKNVQTKTIIEGAKKHKVDIIGLSALMTTTMIAMKEVIKTKEEFNLSVPIIIGGAAVTRIFAQEIGADGYAKDAMEAVNVAKSLITK
ncbi:MAG: homocysteine S-methyltransferase family protein [bacterium]